MGRPVDVKTVNILWEKQSNHLFKLEGSGDGKRWTTIEDKTSGQNDSKEDTVENKTGKPRDFRITVTGNNQSNWASIREITFKNDKGEIIRPQAAAGTSKVDNPSSPSFNDKNWRALNLPHDWGVEGPFRMEIENRTGKLPWVGIGWYRKTLEIPADAKGNQFYLDFDGVMSRPKIYVNGHLAGEWKYGYSSFRVDITPFLKFRAAKYHCRQQRTIHPAPPAGIRAAASTAMCGSRNPTLCTSNTGAFSSKLRKSPNPPPRWKWAHHGEKHHGQSRHPHCY